MGKMRRLKPATFAIIRKRVLAFLFFKHNNDLGQPKFLVLTGNTRNGSGSLGPCMGH